MVALTRSRLSAAHWRLRPGDRVIFTRPDQTEAVRTIVLGPLRGRTHPERALVWLLGIRGPVPLQCVRPLPAELRHVGPVASPARQTGPTWRLFSRLFGLWAWALGLCQDPRPKTQDRRISA